MTTRAPRRSYRAYRIARIAGNGGSRKRELAGGRLDARVSTHLRGQDEKGDTNQTQENDIGAFRRPRFPRRQAIREELVRN